MNIIILFRSWMSKYVVCGNNKLTTSAYRKLTFSGVFNNFQSFIPTVYKFGLIYTLLHRCFTVTSSYEKFHLEINALKQFLDLTDILFSLLIDA